MKSRQSRWRSDAGGATHSAAPMCSDRPCALVVDDDPLVRRAICRHLGGGFNVYQAASEASALETVERVATRGGFALAFVDYELPDGTGLPVLERLGAWPDSIRVLMSAHVGRLAAFRRCGSFVPLVLEKPLNLNSIEAAKRAALRVFRDKTDGT